MPNIINATNITPPRVPIVDVKTGYISREWYRWFYNLFVVTGGLNQNIIQPGDAVNIQFDIKIDALEGATGLVLTNIGVADATPEPLDVLANGGLIQVCLTLDDTEGDGTIDCLDNCRNDYNPGQEDQYPPQGNGIGDACDCEGDFDCDQDCDGRDASDFKNDFGRSLFRNPCNENPLCKGDFNCDLDVDGSDATMFKNDFGRSRFKNPCPTCVMDEWCTY